MTPQPILGEKSESVDRPRIIPRGRILTAVAVVIVLVSIVRIVATYSHTAETFDEPCHIAAGIEFLDKGTYRLDPVHPPLARVAIGLPLRIAGERYPVLPSSDPSSRNYNTVGNHILYDDGHLTRNLALARIGVLPFFILGAVTVYLWTGQLAGSRSALVAIFLYCTVPLILAFSSIAYTDIVAASTQVTAIYVFSLWLVTPDTTRTVWLGLAGGVAFLAKLTTVLFLPAAALCMAIVWFAMNQNHREEKQRWLSRIVKLFTALILSAVVVWAGYKFSVGRLQEETGITASNMPSFQHFPAPVRGFAQRLILKDPLLPAPELLHGISEAWVLNRTASGSYLLGQAKAGGTWYFYLVALGVKLPLPLLFLLLPGVLILAKRCPPTYLLPLAALTGILLITMRVSYQVGTRHVLVAVPLIAMVAALGLQPLLERASFRSVTTWTVAALLAWQVLESGAAQSDPLAYFNELAGGDPSKVLVTGCDLDCGQDLFRLVDELRERRIEKVGLAVWSSADTDRIGLPQYEIPGPAFHGWIALSSRALRLGDVLHQDFPQGYFSWIERYRPEAMVGKTIRLYYIPSPSP